MDHWPQTTPYQSVPTTPTDQYQTPYLLVNRSFQISAAEIFHYVGTWPIFNPLKFYFNPRTTVLHWVSVVACVADNCSLPLLFSLYSAAYRDLWPLTRYLTTAIQQHFSYIICIIRQVQALLKKGCPSACWWHNYYAIAILKSLCIKTEEVGTWGMASNDVYTHRLL